MYVVFFFMQCQIGSGCMMERFLALCEKDVKILVMLRQLKCYFYIGRLAMSDITHTYHQTYPCQNSVNLLVVTDSYTYCSPSDENFLFTFQYWVRRRRGGFFNRCSDGCIPEIPSTYM